ncbi:MAG: LysR family transcriptional regulator [Sphingomonas sp.]
MDRMSALEAFVTVAEAMSFAGAAHRLRCSPPMVTLRIRHLEAHLGVSLFNRTTRRVDLTEDGRQFLTYARATLEAFAAAEQAVRPGGGVVGSVRLDAPAAIGHGFIVPALSDLHRAYPGIRLTLSLGDRGMLFRLDGFDLALRAGDAPQSGWRVTPLGHTRLICLASPAYLARHGVPAAPSALEAHRCILYASVEAPGGEPWKLTGAGGEPLRVHPPASFIFNDGGAIMAAARAGLGMCQTLEMLARHDLHTGRLVQVLADAAVERVPLVLMSAQDRLALPHVRAVHDYLVERIGGALGNRAVDGA